jgi:hypothetical protein
MKVITEGDLQISLPASILARKFDVSTHGLSQCMKAVDFILELDNKILFVEFKDPDNPKTKAKNRAGFIEDFLSGKLDSDLQYKYRDSYLYELASGRADKSIYYYVLIGAHALSDADLLLRTEALKNKIPLHGAKGKPWKKPFLSGCAVMNLRTWNKALPMYPASRLS